MTGLFVACWLLAGGVQKLWWMQFGCWLLAAILMAEINNLNALIRVYSRMPSCTFLALSCCACFLFPSVESGVTVLCFCAAWLLLFNGYQDKQSTGWTFYAFICMGVGSLLFPQALFFLPLTWLLMASLLQSMSWRTWLASLLGLLLPYWFLLCWLTWTADFGSLVDHWHKLTTLAPPLDYGSLSIGAMLAIALCTVLGATSTIHFLLQKINDKIRVRQLSAFFYWMSAYTLLLMLLQPAHIGCLLPVLIASVSPLVGHFVTLGHSRFTNATFVAATAAAIAITAFNLWNMH